MSRLHFALSTVLFVVLGAPLASADIAPPPGFVEQCTVANHAVDGKQCIKCGDAYHGERDACSKVWEPKGYARACKTRGASTWSEVWCAPEAAAKPAPPAPTPVPDEPADPPEGDTAKPAGDTATPAPKADEAVKKVDDTPKKAAEKKSACQGGGTSAAWPLALLLLAVPLGRARRRFMAR